MEQQERTARITLTLSQAVSIGVALLAYVEHCQDAMHKETGLGATAYWEKRIQAAEEAMRAWESMEWQ